MSITTAHDKDTPTGRRTRANERPSASEPLQGLLHRPEFFRLPKTGGDPYFGLTRPHYYALEKEGKIKLTRVRKNGAAKGVTLVPFAAVLRMLRSA